LKDQAGNPTTVTRTALTCASTSPTVAFIDPVSDSTPFSDVTKRILATTNTTATRHDKNGTTFGTQYDVIACTSAPAGSSAILSTGYMGQTLTQAATTSVVADTGNLCSGSGNLVQFTNALLPESLTDSSFNLATATELQVAVTDLNLATGDEIPIEERSPDEVRAPFGKAIVPEDYPARNPAFDVTPHRYVTGIVTENGIVYPPFDLNLRRAVEGSISPAPARPKEPEEDPFSMFDEPFDD